MSNIEGALRTLSSELLILLFAAFASLREILRIWLRLRRPGSFVVGPLVQILNCPFSHTTVSSMVIVM